MDGGAERGNTAQDSNMCQSFVHLKTPLYAPHFSLDQPHFHMVCQVPVGAGWLDMSKVDC